MLTQHNNMLHSFHLESRGLVPLRPMGGRQTRAGDGPCSAGKPLAGGLAGGAAGARATASAATERSQGTGGGLAAQQLSDAFALPLLSADFCAQLLAAARGAREEAEKRQQVTPGLLLSARWYLNKIDGSFTDLFDRLLTDVLRIVDEALFAESHPIAYHQAYCINYEEGRDVSLKAHTDDSDLTVNVFLGHPGFSGSELMLLEPSDRDVACGTPRWKDPTYEGRSVAFRHETVGTAVLHPGDRWHAVEPLTSGSRWNLIIMAMRNDKEWKRTFYEETASHLAEKASWLAAGS
ncbi:unnamed protein product [Effrenium voratum]|nr:unnamed protein product [Effrenium voratum]